MVVDGCVELLGLDVAQACTNVADKKEVVQYIESAASKGLGMQEEVVAGYPAAGR